MAEKKCKWLSTGGQCSLNSIAPLRLCALSVHISHAHDLKRTAQCVNDFNQILLDFDSILS